MGQLFFVGGVIAGSCSGRTVKKSYYKENKVCEKAERRENVSQLKIVYDRVE